MPDLGDGFQAVADSISTDVGDPLEDEAYLPSGTHSVQTTTKGVCLYSVQGNKPLFLEAARGAEASQPAPSDGYEPEVYYNPGVVASSFSGMPHGVVLHGSRGGHQISQQQEFDGTRKYAVGEPNGLGWNITCGEDQVAIHLPAQQWGWHARACSKYMLSCEFAQPLESYDITDGQVRAFCWWLREKVFPVWPELRNVILADPTHALPTHAEVEQWGWTGNRDGKSDVFSYGSERTDDLRARILARLQR